MHADYEIVQCDKISLKALQNGNSFNQYKKKINNLWESDPLVNQGVVFNGSLLMLEEIDQVSLSEINLIGKFTGYKYFYISRNYENIPYRINPIGVSGIIFAKDSADNLYTMVGKRSNSVSNYPGYYELLPSGSVDDLYWNPDTGLIDYEKNLITEFKEETGLEQSVIKEINILGLIHDRKENYYDITCEIILKESYKEIEGNLNLNSEYDEILFLPVDKLEEFLLNERDYLVPTSVGLIEHTIKKYV